MVSWSALALPAALSAVLVFVVSSLVHMVLKWHNTEYGKLANEDEVRAALNKGGAKPGMYVLPHCTDHKQLGEPALQKKFAEGPVGLLVLRPAGPPSLGAPLSKWFLYSLVVSLIAGYVARSTLAPGADYLAVFRVVGVSAWLAYAWQAPSDAIWKGIPMASVIKYMTDGLMYALVTAGAFAWLWPR